MCKVEIRNIDSQNSFYRKRCNESVFSVVSEEEYNKALNCTNCKTKNLQESTMTKKQLLVDAAGVNGLFHVISGLINESKSERGYPLVKGILQREDALNQNRRRYPSDILRREVKNYEQLIKERRALGELDHPDSQIISLANASHNIVEMHWEGKDLIGTVEILPTPSGNILRELINAGITVGISSRGMGSVQEVVSEEDGEPELIVQNDFSIVAWDMVSNPSTHQAFMKPLKEEILTEGNLNSNINKYSKLNSIISNIICDSTGRCDCSPK